MQTNPFEDTVIAGGGPIGLACAISARRCGVDPLVLEAGAIADSIVRYPTGMGFFTTPELLEIGGHPFVCAAQKPTREEALKYYRGVARAEALRVRTYTRLVSASRNSDVITCTLDAAEGRQYVDCRRLVLATGYFGDANLMRVAGESLPFVSHYFDEPHLSYGRDVVVIGGRNSAVEAALELFRAGAHVTLVYRGTTFPASVKYWVKPDIENRIAAGEIAARLGATVLRIEPGAVVVQCHDGTEELLHADRVYALTGFRADFALFRRIGIELEPDTERANVDPETLETNVPGVYMAGSIVAGRFTSGIFIENGRFDGDKIFRC
ncbi:MAG: YpdA family putative bacillithiol disulfide reductase [Gemmatimonadota bacterium]|nr:YpdA family putative bacillithiol disulfide reductase [Gemmatimonadota bacterium]